MLMHFEPARRLHTVVVYVRRLLVLNLGVALSEAVVPLAGYGHAVLILAFSFLNVVGNLNNIPVTQTQPTVKAERNDLGKVLLLSIGEDPFVVARFSIALDVVFDEGECLGVVVHTKVVLPLGHEWLDLPVPLVDRRSRNPCRGVSFGNEAVKVF